MPESYDARERFWMAKRDGERRRSASIAHARLATFLAALAALTWWIGFGGNIPAFALAAVLLAAFGIFVVVHARTEERAERFEALRVVNARGAARIARDWDRLPDAAAPAGVTTEHHPYAVDLDVFGHASVFQLLGPAATPAGNRALARCLLDPAPSAVIVARQRAVEELAAADEWREQLGAFGVTSASARPASLERFLAWAESPGAPIRRYGMLRAAVYLLCAAIWIFLPLHASGVLPNSIWSIALVLGLVLSFATAWSVTRAFDDAGSGERTLRDHADVLAHVDAHRFEAPLLGQLRGRLSGDGRSAPASMRALNRVLGFAELRRGAAILHFPIQALTLWDFHCLFALEGWRRKTGPHVRGWFDAAGEIDALSCLATLRYDNPDWTFPTIVPDRQMRARALGHPLIPAPRRISNDVVVGPPGTLLLVTGSNMSGKSTLLRAIGLNAVLAQAGAPVAAAALDLPPCDIQTSIRIQDSLERGVSYFMAALARLKGVVDAAQRQADDRVLLYLLDEILQGTNSAERGIAVQAVAAHLLGSAAIGVMTTHDLNLASDEPLRSSAHLAHFTEIVDPNGRMSFDYRLREGLATSRNALRLMQLIGIEISGPVAEVAPALRPHARQEDQ